MAGDAFYHYSVSDYDAYTIIVVIERLDDVVVQFVNRDSSYGKVGKRKIIPRQKLLEYRYDYLGRTILTKELEARLNYEHDLYLYNDAVQEAQYIQKYYGRTLKYKKPKNVSIPEVEYKPFPDIHIWV